MRICSIEGCGKKHKGKGFCHNHYAIWYHWQNRDRQIAKMKERYWENPEAARNRVNEYYHNNVEERKQVAREWKQNNPDKVQAQSTRWRNENREKVRAYSNARKKRVRHCIPKWADQEAIKQFYLNCPKGMVVDHIIPLKGDLISGLHLEDNLQYLTYTENAKKNKFIDLDILNAQERFLFELEYIYQHGLPEKKAS